MAMSYGKCTAQIAMGASRNRPSRPSPKRKPIRPFPHHRLFPCLNHGIKGGLGNSQMQAKRAVEAGYWSLYHYDPRRIGQGENPFVLRFQGAFQRLQGIPAVEVRYSSLKRQFPERAEMLYEKAEADAKARRSNYTRLANK